jgi:hypothetical protein
MLQVCSYAAQSFDRAGRFEAAMAPLACVRAFPRDQRKATAAWIRLECLAAVVADPRMADWHLGGTDAGGALRLSDHVFHAAAVEPVLSDEEGRAPRFDADGFFARVTALALASAR